MRLCLLLLSLGLTPLALLTAQEAVDVTDEQLTLIPKREIGALAFLEAHPEYDGRDTIIAVLDTGIDPAAAGMQVTTTGERKIVDVIDATSAGDVDMSGTAEPDADGNLTGLTGRTLTLPDGITNPDGTFRLGLKVVREMLSRSAFNRLQEVRRERWEKQHNARLSARLQAQAKAEAAGERPWENTAEADLTRAQLDARAREELRAAAEDNFFSNDPGPLVDCVLWHDGEHWRAVVDTDEDGDLADETILRPFGIAGEYAVWAENVPITFAIQVYAEGALLSLVTVSGSHGTHVAAIAAAHDPANPRLNGVAPGARLLSIRIGDPRRGGSSGWEEKRALAACAQYGVDVANVSWGGSSRRNDGTEFVSKLFNRMVRTYGITAFISAGNNGPALSSTGAAGGEATDVIGVGAYISPEMVRVLYNVPEEAAEAAYHFTSVGPNRNGDRGVDIMAPGGATASLAFDQLRSSQLYHGTSMSAPSAAGVGALLVSAAKAEGIDHRPARIRAALMNSARDLPGISAWEEGAGLIQVGPAWEHLRTWAEEPAFGLFYDVDTPDNTFTPGPGLYRREPLRPGEHYLTLNIGARFPDGVDDATRFAFARDLELRPTVDWVTVPEYFRLTHGRDALRLIMAPPVAPGVSQALYGEVQAFLADAPEAGPLFIFPLSIVTPAAVDPAENFRATYTVELTGGERDRRFFTAPAAASRVEVTLHRLDRGDDLRRSASVTVYTPQADRSIGATEEQEYAWIEPGESFSVVAEVAPEQVTEVVVMQTWSYPRPARYEVEVRYLGVESEEAAVAVRSGQTAAPVRLRGLTDESFAVTTKLEHAMHTWLPTTTEIFPGGPRDLLPPGPDDTGPMQGFVLRQTYEISVEEPTTFRFESSDDVEVDQDYAFPTVRAIHESGDVVLAQLSWGNRDLRLPKGTTYVVVDWTTFNRDLLSRLEAFPLMLARKLDKPVDLTLYAREEDWARQQAASEVALDTRRDHTFYLAAPGGGDLPELKPAPKWFAGSMVLKDDREREVREIEITVDPRPDFSKVANQAPEPKPLPDEEKAPADALAEDLFQRRLTFVRDLRGTADEEERAARDAVLAELLADRPDDADLAYEHAMAEAVRFGLVSAWHADIEEKTAAGDDDEYATDGDGDAAATEETGSPAVAEDPEPQTADIEAVLALVAKARDLSDPEGVARFFGAPPVAPEGDPDARHAIERERKERQEQRDRLARIALLKADIHFHADDREAAREALREVARWQDKPGDDALRLTRALDEADGFHGLVLKRLNARIDEEPHDRKLRQERIDLYRELGWDELAAQEERRLALWASDPRAHLWPRP